MNMPYYAPAGNMNMPYYANPPGMDNYYMNTYYAPPGTVR